MKNYSFLFALFLGLVSFGSYAQDANEGTHNVSINVPEVALLDLEAANGTNVTLQATAPTEAGMAATFGSDANDSSIWINYSSIIGSTTESSRNVTVQITNGDFPPGLWLYIDTAADAGNGDGTMGNVILPSTLASFNSQTIINGIGSAYTGDGVSNGHNITYRLRLDPRANAYEQLDFDSNSTIVMTYTLTDN